LQHTQYFQPSIQGPDGFDFVDSHVDSIAPTFHQEKKEQLSLPLCPGASQQCDPAIRPAFIPCSHSDVTGGLLPTPTSTEPIP
jgi:hypothetical protein